MKNIDIICERCSQQRHEDFQKQLGDRDIQVGMFAKLKFSENGMNEHMWVKITEVTSQETFIGTVNNEPFVITNVGYGDDVLFNREDIEDLLK